MLSVNPTLDKALDLQHIHQMPQLLCPTPQSSEEQVAPMATEKE
jgi:hypothetical protein